MDNTRQPRPRLPWAWHPALGVAFALVALWGLYEGMASAFGALPPAQFTGAAVGVVCVSLNFGIGACMGTGFLMKRQHIDAAQIAEVTALRGVVDELKDKHAAEIAALQGTIEDLRHTILSASVQFATGRQYSEMESDTNGHRGPVGVVR